MMDELKADIENKLKIKVDNSNIHYFNDGATDSIVFAIENKYLIKTVDELTYKAQTEFFNIYDNNYFQKLVYGNKELSYLCFEYIEGNKIKEILEIDVDDLVKQVYDITSNYQKYDYDGYGYLFDDYNKSWYQFLYDEVIYSKKEIKDVSVDKVLNALNVISKYKIEKYLIHGDFGVHNFLFNSNKLYAIDPMGVIGDYLYDFYFAIFSSPLIFTKINIDYILSFFNDDFEYKKALLIVVVYIRMSRAHKYDNNNFIKYLQLYNEL